MLKFLGLGLVVAVIVLAVGLPIRCHTPIAKPPYRGCLRRVAGLLGKCHTHGSRPMHRLIAVLGGRHLAERRICKKCGRSAVFCRARDTGRPFLGCIGYPNCRTPRQLGN